MKTISSIMCAVCLLGASACAAEALKPVAFAKPPAGVERIELFLLIGQSNMKGRGEVPATQTPDPRIAMLHFKTDQWFLARHPLHHAGDPVTLKGGGNEGVGPGLAFAQALLVREPKIMVGLVPCAVGGSKLNLWMKGGRLYVEALRRARLALATKSSVPVALKGALWLQGEADATPELQPTYQARLARMIDALRADLAVPELPFVAATIGEFRAPAKAGPSGKSLINEALFVLPKQRAHTACVDARDLQGHIGDGVHYNAASANIIGERMAAKYFELQAQLVGSEQKGKP
jgi:hypothetical protein